MGIISNIKEKMKQIFNRNKVKALNPASHEVTMTNATQANVTKNEIDLCENPSLAIGYACKSITPNEHVSIKDLKVESINAETGNRLVLARLGKAKDGKAESFYNTGDYVAFEIENGTKLDKNMIRKLAAYYDYASQIPENFNKECCYYGVLNKDPNDVFKNKNVKVQQYVEQTIVPKIRAEYENINQRNEMYYKQKDEPRKVEYQQSYLSNEEIEKGREANRLEKVGKIKNLYLQKSDSYYNEFNKVCHDYNATDTYTGDFLRINKLDKVAKDESGRYIYTAFLSRTSSLSNAVYRSLSGNSIGVPVCFTMDGRFEDVVKNQNLAEMKPLLDMLSSRETFDRSNKVLNYIGCLEKSGNINKDILSNSPAIVNTINKLQHQFYLQNKESNDDQER